MAMLEVGAKAYRYEDPRGGPDWKGEYGKPWLCECPVVRTTACATVLWYMGGEVYWYEGGNNRFSRTPEDALKSYIYRKHRAVRYAEVRAERQKALLTHAESGRVENGPGFLFG